MDKKQQIEEITKSIYRAEDEAFCCTNADHCENCWCVAKDLAEALYAAGYRKIDKNCYVMTKDELREYKNKAVKEVLENLKEDISGVYPEYIPEIIDNMLEEY